MHHSQIIKLRGSTNRLVFPSITAYVKFTLPVGELDLGKSFLSFEGEDIDPIDIFVENKEGYDYVLTDPFVSKEEMFITFLFRDLRQFFMKKIRFNLHFRPLLSCGACTPPR